METITDLHARYDRPLRAYTAKLLRGTGVDADDVVQEVWINADCALCDWRYRRERIELACPAGMRTAGVQIPEGAPPLGYVLARDTPYGGTMVAVELATRAIPRTATVQIGMLCRKAPA